MKTLDPAEITELEARAGIVARTLVWITAREIATGDPVSLGLWSGSGARTFTIGGASRLYEGPALAGLPAITAGVGLAVREYRVPVPHLTPEAQAILADYEVRLAPVEIHQALFSAATRKLIAEPRRIFRGWVDRAPLTTGAAGTEGGLEWTLVSAARALTRKPALFVSDADQRRRDPDDRFLEAVSQAALREVRWGEKSVQPAGVTPAPAPRVDPDQFR